MANYYTQWAFYVPFASIAEAKMAHQAVPEDFEHAPDGFPLDEDEYPSIPLVFVEDDALFFSDEGGDDLDATIELVRWLLGFPGAPDVVEFEWGETCDKNRAGGFGGGCARITKDGAQTLNTGQALQLLALELGDG